MAVYVGDDIALQVGDGGGPETFSAVGQVTNFTAPEKTLQMVTNYFIGSDEPTKTPSNFEFGPCSFDIVLDPDNAAHASLEADLGAKNIRNFKLVITGATADEFLFTGYVTAYNSKGGSEEELTASLTIETTAITPWA